MAASTPPSQPQYERQTIRCLYCHQQQEVALRAMSVTCKFCYKPLKLDAISITHYEARRQIATCGTVVVEKKGHAVAESVKCGGLIVRGKLKGAVESQGTVLVGQHAELNGDVTAPSLAVAAGAVLDGQYDIGPKGVAMARPGE